MNIYKTDAHTFKITKKLTTKFFHSQRFRGQLMMDFSQANSERHVIGDKLRRSK